MPPSPPSLTTRSWQDKKGELIMRVESGCDTKLGESFDSAPRPPARRLRITVKYCQ